MITSTNDLSRRKPARGRRDAPGPQGVNARVAARPPLATPRHISHYMLTCYWAICTSNPQSQPGGETKTSTGQRRTETAHTRKTTDRTTKNKGQNKQQTTGHTGQTKTTGTHKHGTRHNTAGTQTPQPTEPKKPNQTTAGPGKQEKLDLNSKHR